jgi:hypothetical protein
MVQSASPYSSVSDPVMPSSNLDIHFQLPDPDDDQIPDVDFDHQVRLAWQVCDRFDLQTDIWRGRILRSVRDREKRQGEGRGSGFLNWLKDHEISKSQAYAWIELANSADTLLEQGMLDPGDVNQFSKRAFVETSKASPEVQQLISDAARRGDRITRREVRQVSDDWMAMSSDLIPVEVREKAASNTIPARYVAPLVRELEKLPESHQTAIQAEIAANPDLDTLKNVTTDARYLAKYLQAATNVQALNRTSLDLEAALEEALRLGCLSSVADLVNQASQLEQTIAKLFTTWKRLTALEERVYLDSGASTPHLRSLLECLTPLSGDVLEVQLGDLDSALSRTIRIKILPDEV